MFDKKAKPAQSEPLYRIVTIGELYPDVDLNKAAEGGYRFLDWLDDKWIREGYDSISHRRAVYIKQ